MRFAVALTTVLMACAGDAPARPGDGFYDVDAGADVPVPADRPDGAAPVRAPLGGPCATDAECDDGRFCDGVERCVSGRCARGADPCDDGARCTRETCDEAARRCARVADESVCGDGDPCNGAERCDPSSPTADRATGCARAAHGVDCNDGDPCTTDTCAAGVGCAHAPRDLDRDGHVDRACAQDRDGGALGDDCDDRDPTAHRGATERCDDGRDNDCDGLVDLADAVACRATNDACVRAIPLRGEGDALAIEATTAAFAPGPPLACTATWVTRPTAWFRVTLAAPRAVTVRVEDGARVGEVPGAVALVEGCDATATPPCAMGSMGRDGRAGADPVLTVPRVAAGTWYIAVQSSGARPFSLRVTLAAPAEGP